jgi:hypothetical protein
LLLLAIEWKIHIVKDARRTETRAAEPLVLESSFFEGEIDMKSRKYINRQVLFKFQQN